MLVKHGDENEKKIDYVEYLKEAIEKAEANAPVRKSDVKTLK